ncbi:MAG: AAA family ATPase, partial [Prevotella sp.]|nr:AAA family ATPase [Prevotella sp.]
MATPIQKNTITNYFRVSSLEDLNADTNGKRYPDNPGGEPVFIARSAYEVIDTTPPPVDLWHGLWYQGEMACLFGEPNVGKTILAMRIASDIVARGESVLYFDFENAEHQLLPRYAEHSFDEPNSPRFTILTPNYFNHDLPESNRDLLPYILKTAVDSCVNVVIIDDITHLFGTGDPADVRHVLNRLRSWVKQHRLSVLVLAHARRRKPLQPITLEHLAGSYECAYSFDSIFSLNRANRHYRRDKGISAYIKQHKSRMGEVIYDDENVITASLRFDESSRSLTFCNFMIDGNERQLLRDFGFHSREEILQAVLRYKDRSLTICEIAERVGISKSQVGRLLKEHYDENSRPPAPAQRPLPPMTTEPINPHPVCSQTVVDQGGIDTLLVDDDQLPMRRIDPATGQTYKYYPDLNFSVKIKPDEFINLPLYLPPQPATLVGTARAVSAPSQELAPAVAKPVRAEQNLGRGETPVTDAQPSISPVGASELCNNEKEPRQRLSV